MQRRRYYLAGVSVLALGGGPALLAQSASAPPAVDAKACLALASRTVPAEPDSTETLKQLIECGYTLNTDSEYRASQEAFARATAMARRLSDRRALAAALAGYGMTFRALGQADRAEPLLRESLQVSEEEGDKDGMAEAFSQLARVRHMQARYDESRAYHTRSFELWNEIGNMRGAAVALNNVGAAYRAVGDYVTALEYYQRSAERLDQMGDRRRSATVLDNMGSVAKHLGDYEHGLALTRQALEIRQSLNDRLGIANSLDSLSASYQAAGNYAAALGALHESLEIRRALGAAHGTAEALANIASVYQAQGSYAQADAYLRRALALNEKVGSKSLLAEIHTRRGEVLLLQGLETEALQSLRRSLAIAQPAGYKTQEADALYALGRVHLGQGRLTAAADALQRCLEIRESSRALRGRAETLIELADVELRRRKVDRGLALADEAEQLAGAMELPEVRWRALTVKGRLEVAMKRRAAAREAFDAAIAIVEDLRWQVAGGDDARSRFFADRQAPYQERIALALAESQTAEAFHVAERSKARVLLDVIRGDRVPITAAMTADERARELRLRTALGSFNIQVMVAAQAEARNDARLATARRTRDAARLEYEDFLATLYGSHPDLQVSRAAVPSISARDATTLLSGSSAAIVEFVVGRERTWAFAIDASGISVIEVPVTATELGRQVAQFRGQVAGRDLRASITAQQLHELVLGPIRAVLQGKTELIVVPDGVLWDLPFQALRSAAGRYLIEDVAVSYAPSVTVLREAMRARDRRSGAPTLLAFGNPDFGTEAIERRKTVLMDDRLDPLPDAETQVNRLAQLYGPSSRVYVGQDAREDRLKADAGDHGIVHLATHGVADNRSPLYSYVVLAKPEDGSREDGLLEAWEIMSMRLTADLVVLSACETARGQISAGEGVIGLMWAFFVAGSPSTLVTQWKVEAASSTELMVAFHTAWNGGRGGVTKAAALQRASLQLLRSRDYGHPFYWAGYILAGDRR